MCTSSTRGMRRADEIPLVASGHPGSAGRRRGTRRPCDPTAGTLALDVTSPVVKGLPS
jgi:hypothetical protein